MGIENFEDDTTTIIREFVAGEILALDALVRRYYTKMVEIADRCIRRLQMDRAAYDGDDAVNNTLLKLSWRARDGELGSIQSSDEFWRLFSSALKTEIRDTRDRDSSLKRGGAGSHQSGPGRDHGKWQERGALVPRQSFRRNEVNLDSLDSRVPPLADLVLIVLEIEEFLECIADPTHRQIAIMKLDGYTNQEIARLLELNKKTIERKLESIRTTYLKYGAKG